MTIRSFALIATLAMPLLSVADDTRNPPSTSSKTTGTTGSKTSPTDTPRTADASALPTAGVPLAKSAKISSAELELVVHVHHVNLMEIDMGKLARRNGTTKVKSYGTTLIKDHTSANKDLKALAKKKGIATIPKHKPTTEHAQHEHQDMKDAMAHMKTLKGAEFDREFLTMMVADHDKELGRVDAAMTTVSDAELKTFLTNLRPTLQRHADQARELQRGVTEVSTAGQTGSTRSTTTTPGTNTGTTTTPSRPSTGTGTGTGNTTTPTAPRTIR